MNEQLQVLRNMANVLATEQNINVEYNTEVQKLNATKKGSFLFFVKMGIKSLIIVVIIRIILDAIILGTPLSNIYGISVFSSLLSWILFIVLIVREYRKKRKDEKTPNVINSKIDKEISETRTKYSTMLQNFRGSSATKEIRRDFQKLRFPEEYTNSEDIWAIIGTIENGRADSLKEAFSILEQMRHHYNIENFASRQAEATEQSARADTEMVNIARKESSMRQQADRAVRDYYNRR